MVVTKKGKKKKPGAAAGDTPITVGGGGDGVASADVTIAYNQGMWTQTPGRLTLTRGKIKSFHLTFDGVSIQMPVKGTMSLVLDCNKP